MGSELKEIKNSDDQICREEWQTMLDKYANEYDLERHSHDGSFKRTTLQNHPLFYNVPVDINWSRLIPHDSVIQIKNSTDVYNTFKEIVDRTVAEIKSVVENSSGNLYKENVHYTSDELEKYSIYPGDRGYIASNIVRRFCGDVHFNGSAEEHHPGTSIPKNITVVVTSITDNNYDEWRIYTINNTVEIFEESYQSCTKMFYDLMESSIEPEQTVSNVAFSLTGSRIPKLSPPSGNVTIGNINQDDIQFWEVNDCKSVFADSWGFPDKMTHNCQLELEEPSSYNSTWWITTGI